MKEDFQAVLDLRRPWQKDHPFPVAALAVMVLRVLETFKLSPLYKWVYETAFKECFVSIEKAERVLGTRPNTPTLMRLIRNYKWYVENLSQVSTRQRHFASRTVESGHPQAGEIVFLMRASSDNSCGCPILRQMGYTGSLPLQNVDIARLAVFGQHLAGIAANLFRHCPGPGFGPPPPPGPHIRVASHRQHMQHLCAHATLRVGFQSNHPLPHLGQIAL